MINSLIGAAAGAVLGFILIIALLGDRGTNQYNATMVISIGLFAILGAIIGSTAAIVSAIRNNRTG